jgi:ABC-2 type transport system permease protein
MTYLMYRFQLIFTSFSNIFYIFIIYFLWKAIYANTGSGLNTMTFNQTFVYLSLAATVFILFETWTEWKMSDDIITGNIIIKLIKPLDFQLFILFNAIGILFINFIIITIPAVLIIIFFFNTHIPVGYNIPIFFFSILIAFMINFSIDYIIGCVSFKTHSIFGISITKQSIVLFLSGALIPLNFFPPHFKAVLEKLPFQAIYNIPLTILLKTNLNFMDYITYLGIQLFWVFVLVVLSRFIYLKVIKVITVSGG